MSDKVNPTHYDGDRMVRSAAKRGNARAFCLENAAKYLWRAGRKPGENRATDLKKALWYLQWISDHGRTYDPSYYPARDTLLVALNEIRVRLLENDPNCDAVALIEALEDP